MYFFSNITSIIPYNQSITEDSIIYNLQGKVMTYSVNHLNRDRKHSNKT
jgi:hypothetical protein